MSFREGVAAPAELTQRSYTIDVPIDRNGTYAWVHIHDCLGFAGDDDATRRVGLRLTSVEHGTPHAEAACAKGEECGECAESAAGTRQPERECWYQVATIAQHPVEWCPGWRPEIAEDIVVCSTYQEASALFESRVLDLPGGEAYQVCTGCLTLLPTQPQGAPAQCLPCAAEDF